MPIDRESLEKDGYSEISDGWWEKWHDFSAMMAHKYYCGSWIAIKMDETGRYVQAMSFWHEYPQREAYSHLKGEARNRLRMNIFYDDCRRQAAMEYESARKSFTVLECDRASGPQNVFDVYMEGAKEPVDVTDSVCPECRQPLMAASGALVGRCRNDHAWVVENGIIRKVPK